MRGTTDRHGTSLRERTGVVKAPPLMPLSWRWHEPTLKEFVRQVEHEFGRQVDLSSLRHVGLGGDEPLDPSDVRELCELLGLPAEDFGVSS